MTQNKKPLISFDYAIKYLIRDKKDYEIVEGFISALLGTIGYSKVKIISVLETESNKEQMGLKKSIADLVVEDENHNKYLIEIERNEKKTYVHKACFNTSRLIVDNLSTEQDYGDILKVFHISLLYFDVDKRIAKQHGTGVIYHGKTIIHDIDTKQKLSVHITNPKTDQTFDAVDILPEYLFISVPAFNDTLKREIDDWLYVMKHDEIPEDYHSPYMQKVANKLSILKMNEDERLAYYKYHKEIHSARDEIQCAIEKGIEKGREEERKKAEQEKLAIAKAMFNKGISIEDISKITNIPIDILKKLQLN